MVGPFTTSLRQSVISHVFSATSHPASSYSASVFSATSYMYCSASQLQVIQQASSTQERRGGGRQGGREVDEECDTIPHHKHTQTSSRHKFRASCSLEAAVREKAGWLAGYTSDARARGPGKLDFRQERLAGLISDKSS